MQFDLYAVGKVLAQLVAKHMATSHQIQALITLEKEAAGVGQAQLLVEGNDARAAQENGFDHNLQVSPLQPFHQCESAQRSLMTWRQVGTWAIPHIDRHGEFEMKNRTGSLLLNGTLAGLMTFMMIGCNKPQETTDTPPSVGTEIDDTVITAAIKTAFLANPEVKSLDLKVETRKGEVQLSGFMESQGQIDRATAVAKNVSDVKGIQNKMTLKGSPASVGNTVDDGICNDPCQVSLAQ